MVRPLSLDQHDQEVLTRIHGYINTAAWRNTGGTVEQILETAQGDSVLDRKKWGDDDYTADVSYYLQARYYICKQKHWYSRLAYSEGGICLTYFYNLIKVFANPIQRHLGLHFLESDKGNPNTPASMSSIRWVKRGAYDGYGDNAQQVAVPTVPAIWPYSFAFGT